VRRNLREPTTTGIPPPGEAKRFALIRNLETAFASVTHSSCRRHANSIAGLPQHLELNGLRPQFASEVSARSQHDGCTAVSSKFFAFSTVLVASAATAPGAVLNGEILDRQCEGTVLAGCEGLPPPQYHIDRPEPSAPMHSLIQAHVLSTATGTALHEGIAAIIEGPDLVSGRG
jgi:hypothetical protein